jgi:hypothetical protein
MRRALLALAFALLAGPALAADCYPNAAGTQTNCGAVQMFNNASGQSVPVTAAVPLPVDVKSIVAPTAALGITPTDRTIASTSGSSQTLMAANAARHSLTIMNPGNANCGISPTGGTAVIGGAGTLTLAPLGAYTPRMPTLSAVTVICTAGQPIYEPAMDQLHSCGYGDSRKHHDVGAVAGRFQTLPGKTTVMTADITVTTNNTGSGALDITLPNTAGTGFYICTGINNSTHAILVGQIGFSAQTKVTMTTAAGAYPASDGFRMFVTCSYQNT